MCATKYMTIDLPFLFAKYGLLVANFRRQFRYLQKQIAYLMLVQFCVLAPGFGAHSQPDNLRSTPVASTG